MRRNDFNFDGCGGACPHACACAGTPPTTPVKVHGHVTNPTGAPQQAGVVTFVLTTRAASGPGLSAQTAEEGSFPLNANGDYSGQVVPGSYTVIYRSEGMAKDKQADSYENVKIVAGQDNVQDIDMSRPAYIEKLPEDQKKQLEELRAKERGGDEEQRGDQESQRRSEYSR